MKLAMLIWGCMKHRLKFVVSLVVAVLSYGFGVWALLLIFGQSILEYWARAELWLGLLFAVLLVVLRYRWPRQTFEWVMKFVCITLVAIGIMLIQLARIRELWIDPPWNPSVLGAGVAITALGMSLFIAFWPRRGIQSGGISSVSRKTLITTNTRPRFFWNALMEISRRHAIVTLGLISTVILLVALLLLQHFLPSILQLDVKWMVVAIIPLALALIVGGYIKVIKGFGIELETRIEEPITSLDLRAREVFVPLEGRRKQTLRDLARMSGDQKRRIARLQFITRRRDYYEPDVISQYMHELPNLQYFEIIRPGGMFICLVPVNLFYEEMRDKISRFVDALERNRILDMYSYDAITFTVRAEHSIVEVLEMLRSHGLEVAVVLDSKGAVIGVIKTSDIERRIADEVLFEARRRKK